MLKKLDRAWVFLGHGLHVLMAVLWAVTVATDGWSWIAGAFAVAYVAGMWLKSRWPWLIAVVAAWSLLLFTSPTAAFMAFALFFLLIRFLPTAFSIPSVLFVSVIAIVSLGIEKGFTLGGVIGPIMGALVAIGLGIGFKMLRRETELNERARLAGEIHDTVAQGLVSIQMLLHSVERRLGDVDSRVLSDLQLARHTAETNLEETRRIIASLKPAPLESTDLTGALRRITSTTPMGDAFSFHVDGEPRKIDPGREQSLVRITQSLVSNVVKHAHARAASVTLTYQPEGIRIDVVDNGRGFDPSTTCESSVGLEGIRRRACALGGSLIVESDPGQGCGVSVEVPA